MHPAWGEGNYQMLKKTKMIAADLFRPVLALYLGYTLWDFMLSTFLPSNLQTASVVAGGALFFVVLRWLGLGAQAPDTASRPSRPRTQPAAAPAAACRKPRRVPPLALRHSLAPNWLSSARNRVFVGREC